MKTRNLTTASLLIAIMLGLPGLTGCVGYRLGSMLPADIQRVYIPTFVNRTSEPLIENDCTDAAVRAFQLDGSLKIADAENADAILKVTLEEYSLNPLAFSKDNTLRADEYRAIIYASVIFIRTSPDEVLVHAPRVRGETTFVFSGDISSAKRSALPDLAEDLGHHIVKTVTETW